MEITVDIKAEGMGDMMMIKKYIQTLANNINKENFQFLAELSSYSDINAKLQKHKGKIKTAMVLL